jgi:hypothetical protein
MSHCCKIVRNGRLAWAVCVCGWLGGAYCEDSDGALSSYKRHLTTRNMR